MTKDPISTEVTIKVEFYDCDPMGIVWHGNYARFLEVARCRLLDAIEFSYAGLRKFL